MWWDGSYDWSVGREGKDGGSLGRTGREDKEMVVCSKSMTSWSAWSYAWGGMKSHRKLNGQD